MPFSSNLNIDEYAGYNGEQIKQVVRLDFPGGTGASAPDIDELSVSAP